MTSCHDAQVVGSYQVSNPLRLTVLAAKSEDYTTAPQNLQTIETKCSVHWTCENSISESDICIKFMLQWQVNHRPDLDMEFLFSKPFFQHESFYQTKFSLLDTFDYRPRTLILKSTKHVDLIPGDILTSGSNFVAMPFRLPENES